MMSNFLPLQKEVLNSAPSFFSASLVENTMIRITSQEDDCELRTIRGLRPGPEGPRPMGPGPWTPRAWALSGPSFFVDVTRAFARSLGSRPVILDLSWFSGELTILFSTILYAASQVLFFLHCFLFSSVQPSFLIPMQFSLYILPGPWS